MVKQQHSHKNDLRRTSGPVHATARARPPEDARHDTPLDDTPLDDRDLLIEEGGTLYGDEGGTTGIVGRVSGPGGVRDSEGE